MNENEQSYDDLTVIKYIGPKLQLWLNEKMQVTTYQELAALTVEKIEAQLSVDKKSVARSKIEAWIKEAGELALRNKVEVESAASNTEAEETKVGNQTNSPRKGGDWKEYASFMVYFEAREINYRQEKRIKVSHLEADKSEIWSDLTAENFLWMLDQAGEGPIVQTATEKQPEPEQSIEEARVAVSQIQLFQPPDRKKPLVTSNGKPVSQELNAGKPFSLEVSFSLSGEGAPPLLKMGAKFQVQVVADEVNTKIGTDLGVSDPEALTEGIFDYSVRTPEATLDRGVHRLWAMVMVHAPNAVPSFLEGPSVTIT